MSLTVVFREIMVKKIETNSGVFVGTNIANGWDSHSKNQMSINASENNKFPNNVNIIADNDVIDTLIRDRDSESLLSVKIARQRR
jgi:hypothetical protein